MKLHFPGGLSPRLRDEGRNCIKFITPNIFLKLSIKYRVDGFCIQCSPGVFMAWMLWNHWTLPKREARHNSSCRCLGKSLPLLSQVQNPYQSLERGQRTKPAWFLLFCVNIMLVLMHANTCVHCWGIKQNNEVSSSWGSFLQTVQTLQQPGCNTASRGFRKGDSALPITFPLWSSSGSFCQWSQKITALLFCSYPQGLFF